MRKLFLITFFFLSTNVLADNINNLTSKPVLSEFISGFKYVSTREGKIFELYFFENGNLRRTITLPDGKIDVDYDDEKWWLNGNPKKLYIGTISGDWSMKLNFDFDKEKIFYLNTADGKHYVQDIIGIECASNYTDCGL